MIFLGVEKTRVSPGASCHLMTMEKAKESSTQVMLYLEADVGSARNEAKNIGSDLRIQGTGCSWDWGRRV